MNAICTELGLSKGFFCDFEVQEKKNNVFRSRLGMLESNRKLIWQHTALLTVLLNRSLCPGQPSLESVGREKTDPALIMQLTERLSDMFMAGCRA